jgi:hypothetical protein
MLIFVFVQRRLDGKYGMFRLQWFLINQGLPSLVT